MKKYLLFDLDGTLTDPKVGICTCVQYALASFGIEEPDLDKLEPFIGPPLKDSFMNFYGFDEEQAEAAVEKYRERFSDVGLFENELYPGIPEMLRALNAKGFFLGVASSKPTVYVKRILEHFRIDRYFKVVVGSELDGRRVNKDEVVQEALGQLFGDKTVERDRVYMIGDRSFDVEGARKMGIESVGVTYGYGSMEELKSAKADYIVRSVEELQKFLLRGSDEVKPQTGFQKIWQLLFPFLMFFLVRSAVMYLVQMVFLMIGNAVPNAAFLILYDAEGVPEGLTGNAATLMSAIGFIAGALAVSGTARELIVSTAEDMKLLHIRGESAKSYVLLVLTTVGTVLGVNLLLDLTGMIDKSAAYQAVMEDQYSASLWLGLLCYGIITPIAEELLFRGIIYGYLRKMFKLLPAMVISAVLFGMYHGNSVQGIYAFVMGCLIAYAYEYFGDFRFAVGVHMAANLMAYILSNTSIAVSGFFSMPVCIVCLVWAVGGVYLLNKEKRIYQK